METLNFILIQHTPIIHFQGEQDGIGLRGTELKPKLDKFIQQYMKDQGVQVPDDWCNKKNPCSLDYKLRIDYSEIEKCDIEKKSRNFPPMFFGNMGDDYSVKPKTLVHSANPIKVYFILKSASLKEIIQSLFASFISQTNFGTRQSKGYGCFWLDKENVFPRYHFTLDNCMDWQNAMGKINLFYKAVRSGIHDGVTNRETRVFTTNYYFKSLLFKYFDKLNLKWDKRTTKEEIIAKHQPGMINIQKDKWQERHQSFDSTVQFEEKKFLVRDMLGLSTEQDWLSYDKIKIIKKFIPDSNEDKRGITRYKSPIWFKPFFDWQTGSCIIYFDYNEIDQLYHNAKFDVTASKGGGSARLTTPDNTVFTMEKYFDFLFMPDASGNFLQIETEDDYDTHATTLLLRDIFTQIQNNLSANGK